jgi:hypothetical protein
MNTDVVLPVQKQLEAYNARDIDAFMPWWADDCQYYVQQSKFGNDISSVLKSQICSAHC